jgi:hypothetical protein
MSFVKELIACSGFRLKVAAIEEPQLIDHFNLS